MNTRCHTYTGQGFDPFNPKPEDVKLEDIAHHLSMICRWGGATKVFYSVAEHAARVSRIVEEISGDPAWALLALHHDSAEAYIGDQRRPIKKLLWLHQSHAEFEFESLELSVLDRIFDGLGIYGVNADKPDAWKLTCDADLSMLIAEHAGLLDNPGPWPGEECWIKGPPANPEHAMDPTSAKGWFMATHRRLMLKIEGKA